MRGVRRPTPRVGVTVIIVVLVAVSALLWRLVEAGAPGSVLAPRLSWWVLAPLFAVAEVAVFHVQVRREAQAISVSEVPLVVGLFLASPVEMMVAVLVAAVPVYLVVKRQPPVKALFNTALRVFGVSVTVFAMHVVSGSQAEFGIRAWIGAIAAVAAAGALDGLLVLVVVALHEGDVAIGDLRAELLDYPPLSAIVGCVGLVAVAALHADPRIAVPLLVVGGALVVGYQAHARLKDRHVSLAGLYDFGRSVTQADQIETVLHSVLTGTRELLRAETAEVVLLGGGELPDRRWTMPQGCAQVIERPPHPTGHPGRWASVMADGAPLLLPRGHRDARLLAVGHQEAIVVPLRDDSGILGTLMVADRMGHVRAFLATDIPVLETAANQAALALRNGHLLNQLRHDALHDVLTGLANRAKFRDRLDHAIVALDDRPTSGFAILLLDLNGFKEINDSLGHYAGDALLVHVADRLRAVASPQATVARLGGDEFAVLVPEAATPQAAHAVAEGIYRSIVHSLHLDGIEVTVDASIGVALAPGHARTATSLLRCADEAMYAAKATDGGIRLYDDTAHAVAAHHDPADTRPGGPETGGAARIALLAELRQAITRQQITIHVQPQARTATGEVYGVEALIRWDHPRLGTLSPGEFLDLAERHGLTRAMTNTVLDQAVAAAARWRHAGHDLKVSVNLSPRSLLDVRLLPTIEATLRRYRVPPSRLTLEITEGSVMNDPDQAIAVLETLRSAGVRLSVDDFGTGYSSLSYLRRLPVHEVKIDRSFVTNVAHDASDLLIVRSISDLAANLSLDVVAEGVEDQDAWDQLAHLRCTAVQGYHLARPMPADDLTPWLNGYRSQHPRLATVAPVRPHLRAI
ncbi:MAG: bifunctional diguanylate cyclase/phosphodiesterase [Kineosporiaceae bacterium]